MSGSLSNIPQGMGVEVPEWHKPPNSGQPAGAGPMAQCLHKPRWKEGKVMLRTIVASLGSFLLGAILAEAAGSQPPMPRPARPGSINYVEGEAFIGTSPLNVSSISTLELGRGQSVTTRTGKVEILLTPGVFLRLADNSSLKMILPDLANTEVQLDKGRAMVEVIDIHKENNIRIDQKGASTKLLKKGLYDFDADRAEIRVFKGSVQVNAGNRKVALGADKTVILDGSNLKPQHFEIRQYEDDFYRWCALRSGYLSEASIDVGRTYIGPGPGWYGPGWYGFGWYWDPWFGVYTFLPADGIFYGPFGWGFYSPIAVYRSPFFYYGHYPHRFTEFHYPYGHGFPPPSGMRRR